MIGLPALDDFASAEMTSTGGLPEDGRSILCRELPPGGLGLLGVQSPALRAEVSKPLGK